MRRRDVAVVVDAGLRDDEHGAVAQHPVAERDGRDGLGRGEGFGDDEVAGLVDVHAPLSGQHETQRRAPDDEARIRAEPFRRHDVHGAAEMVLGRRGRQRDVQDDVGLGIDLQVPPPRMRRDRPHHRAPVRREEPLGGPGEVAGLDEDGRRLEQDDGVERVRRLPPPRRPSRAARHRRSSPWPSPAPAAGRRSGRRPIRGRSSAMSGSSVLHTTRCGPPGRDRTASAGDPRRPTDEREPARRSAGSCPGPAAPAAGRDDDGGPGSSQPREQLARDPLAARSRVRNARPRTPPRRLGGSQAAGGGASSASSTSPPSRTGSATPRSRRSRAGRRRPAGRPAGSASA